MGANMLVYFAKILIIYITYLPHLPSNETLGGEEGEKREKDGMGLHDYCLFVTD